MTFPAVVRCPGCGVLNAGDVQACASCNTLLPRTAGAAGVEPAVPAAALSAEVSRAASGAPARVAGVGRLFLGMLLLWACGVVAGKLGARDADVDLASSAAFALIAVACAVAVRAEVGPLLARSGGWGGAATALGGIGVLVAFGAVYFPAIRALGFPLLRVSDAYADAGWPRWAPYLLVSVGPGLYEELLFRGYVMARLDRVLTARETLLVQAALFALLHLGVVIFPSHFVIGLVLGAVRRRTRSLYPGMAVHMGWNALVVWSELSGRNFP